MCLSQLKVFAGSTFLFVVAAGLTLHAQTAPENMGSGLRELVHAYRANEFSLRDLNQSHVSLNPRTGRHGVNHTSRTHMMVDRQNRVMVRILLDGTVPISQVRNDLGTLGVAIVADDAAYRLGAAEAYIPLEQAETIARMAGVAAVNLLRSPVYHVGSVTTQGASILRSDQANTPGVVTPNGVTGKGITVGILSDSYNLAAEPVIGVSLLGPTLTASDDVTSGDLPSTGGPDGRPGLKFLSEGPDGSFDEGRAIAQIIYDMAPSASLCFATAQLGELALAANIRRLRTDSQCGADVIVDDVTYFAEPAFSDGPVGQAVNDVASSGALAGKPVAYFSAAGNNAGSVYSSNIRIVADADARALASQPIDLTTIPSTIDTSGGFFNFNSDANGAPVLSQSFSISQALSTDQSVFILQWDDAFDVRNGVTTDLNLLVFSAAGKFLGASADNNFQTLEPIEGIAIDGNFSGRVVIARTGKGSQAASKLFLYEYAPAVLLNAEFLDPTLSAMFGHAMAKGAVAVAAYAYDNLMVSGQFTPELESYSSAGPVTVCCDATGARLASPEIRQKPEIAAVDFVSTTFFIFPDFGDQFFYFPGTSAAAPHAAGVAALLLEAAGGPGSLTPDQVRSKLIASTGTHDLDPFYSQAVLGDANSGIKLSARGGDNQGGPFGASSLTDTKFFNLQFTSPTAGQTLSTVTIDLGTTGLFFNINARTGFPMKIGASSDGVTATSSVSGTGSTIVTLNFTGLQAGGFVQFGIGRAQRTTRTNGYSADLLAGAKVTATLASPAAQLTGTFVNQMGTGYAPVDGWGLIDAVKAIQAK